jgi:pimeloyl-ACP methyl ester carboxylesterase
VSASHQQQGPMRRTGQYLRCELQVAGWARSRIDFLAHCQCWPPWRLRAAVRRLHVQRGLMAALAAVLLASQMPRPAVADCPPGRTMATHVFGGGLCLAATTFGAEDAGAAPVLVVVVHGDISDGGAATYHVEFARTLARSGVVVVALYRPGYADAAGRMSEGSTLGRQDNYTAANVAAIAGAIDGLKKYHRARRVIYVGHSGGAAIGGVLIGRRPGLIDGAVLASCPCDIARWLRERGRPPWRRSLSPDFLLARVPKTTEVVAITGAADDNTFPVLAHDYAAALARRGVPARFIGVAGAGHGFSGLAAQTQAAVDSMVR